MKKRIITLFTLMLIITSGANFVSAEATTGEEITNTTNPQQTETINENQANQKSENESSEDETKSRVGEKVKSNEKGHYNITFDDGYNGYCINYGKNEAKKNDEFTVQETTAAINNKNGESIGHYLKTFFVEFHDIAVKDKYNTQEIIWGFSDNRNTQNPLIRQIKEASLNLIIPDHGAVKKINDTTEAIFNFEVLSTANNKNQNFFAYTITYMDIPLEIVNNTTSDVEENETIPETEEKPQNNTTKPETEEKPQNNTTKPETEEKPQNNTTKPETEEKPQNNTTKPETEEKPQNNTTKPETEEKPQNNTTKPETEEKPQNNTTKPETEEKPQNNTTKPETEEKPQNNTTKPETEEKPQNNTTKPETEEKPQNNTTKPETEEKIQSTENKTGNTTGIISKVEENSTPIKNEENKSTNLMKHSTGIELPMLIVLILVLGCAIIIKYRRD